MPGRRGGTEAALTVLCGVGQVVPLKGQFLTYACPSYFGMLTASYEPVR